MSEKFDLGEFIAAMEESERVLLECESVFKAMKWKSDKDNTEFTTTIPYTVMDRIRKLLDAPKEQKG